MVVLAVDCVDFFDPGGRVELHALVNEVARSPIGFGHRDTVGIERRDSTRAIAIENREVAGILHEITETQSVTCTKRRAAVGFEAASGA